MAKTGLLSSDPTVSARAVELKKELQRLVRTIADDEDYSIHTVDQAKDTLCALRHLKLDKQSTAATATTTTTSSLKLHEAVSCPDGFKCPLSKELMRDPVILASGQTYDRPFIQKWLNAGNRTCPRTQQVLSHTLLTPNYLILDMISKWCKSQGIELPSPVMNDKEEGVTEAERDHFFSLLEKLTAALPEQKKAAKELRMLTKKMPSFRALFGESVDAIPQLLTPISGSESEGGVHPDLQEDVITTLLNLSIHDSNKKLVAETPAVIPLLMEALKSETIEIRSNAAAALFTLSAIDSNKALIGKLGALKPLIGLLDEGHPLAMKDVASAIFNLCIIHENKARAVRDGAISVILKKIIDSILVDELLAILAMLSTHQRAMEEIGELGGVPCLLRIIRESTCERNKENCIAILHTVCLNDRTKWKALKEEESTHGTISKLAQVGTSRAKRKATGILERLRRAVNITHTA
ncbi:U-box domain-containing protein 9 [Hibiscus syriacus]|uniref:RING-type E3 ubiquitin transferase n=1 Tax=Hibiscus syriacus TaxID=106335 RepID=A0A6A2XLQ7_HIBSY|nr:U-box domain-containing protein 9-like [Hibiscus syriacus]KAE8659319.1 U-box domain-containing protein 9 [Hibiscus syriacus]